MDAIEVRPDLRIPAEEIDISFARSGGPGGQHVNTTATKVRLRFDVTGSKALSEPQKERVREVLGHRMTADGELLLEASEHRSQTRNREAVVARFAHLLDDALRPRPIRRRRAVPRRAKERRLRAKRDRSEKKRLRRPPEP